MEVIIGIRKIKPITLNGYYVKTKINDVWRMEKSEDWRHPNIFISNWSNYETQLKQLGINKINGDNNSVLIEVADDTIPRINDNGNPVININALDCIRFGNKVYANLEMLYSQFCKDLKSKNAREINFDKIDGKWNASKTYDGTDTKKLYILQKCYGYTYVYYEMFKFLFNKLDPDVVNLHVLSIGCGCKADALALKYAKSNNESTNIIIEDTKYVGIDAADWQEFFYLNNDDKYFPLSSPKNPDNEISAHFVNEECKIIRNMKNDLDEFKNNIRVGKAYFLIVFPNMLSEIKDIKALEKLINQIKEVYNGKETYILMSRNPLSADGLTRIDDAQADKIEELLGKQNSFDDVPRYKTLDEEKNAGGIYGEKMYNDKTGDVRRHIGENWSIKNENGELSRNPISGKKYCQYQIYRLTDKK